MPVSVENQMGGGGESVDLDALNNIAGEQAALAAKTAAENKQIEAAAPNATPATEELTPAAKQAAAATKAEEKAETTTFDDFLQQKNTGEKPVASATKQTESQPVAKPATPVVAPETPKQPDSRDLTGIAPEHQEAFKRMSNDAFNQLKPIYIEKQQLAQQLAEAKKGGIPDSYYEHENAYVLTPEFAAQSENVSQAETIYNHYAAQLNALRGGAETYTVLQRNAQGQLVTSAPIKADRADVDRMSDIRQSAHQQLLQAQAQLSAIGQVHKERAAESKNWLSDFNNKAFPIFAQKPELKAVVQDTVQKVLHKSYHNNPLAPLFAQAVIVMQEQAKALANASKAGGAPAQAAPAKVATPSAAEIASGGAAPSNGGEKEVTFDMFQAAKKGLL